MGTKEKSQVQFLLYYCAVHPVYHTVAAFSMTCIVATRMAIFLHLS